ncbi:MAG: alkaline shock response membrane anchor protein AmaP [Dehalococcoidia bacterium]|jgi:hypothetical protein
MNVANRILIVVGLLILVGLALTAIILAWAAGSETIARFSDFARYLNDHDNTLAKLVVTLGSAVVLLLAFSLMILELAPRAERTVDVRDVKAGTAVLAIEAIARRIEQAVVEVPQVETAKAKVAGKGKGVEVALQLLVDPDSDLAAVADAASAVTRDTLTQMMRVELAKPPKVRLYYSRHRVAPSSSAEHTASSPPPSHGRRAHTAPDTTEHKPDEPPAPDDPAAGGHDSDESA